MVLSGDISGSGTRYSHGERVVVCDGGQDNRLAASLGEYADDFVEASKSADDLAEADAYTVLAALACGKSPPGDAAKRVLDRARDSGK